MYNKVKKGLFRVIGSIATAFKKIKSKLSNEWTDADEFYNYFNEHDNYEFNSLVRIEAQRFMTRGLSKDEAYKKAKELMLGNTYFSKERLTYKNSKKTMDSTSRIEDVLANEGEATYRARLRSEYIRYRTKGYSEDDSNRLAKEATPCYNIKNLESENSR